MVKARRFKMSKMFRFIAKIAAHIAIISLMMLIMFDGRLRLDAGWTGDEAWMTEGDSEGQR